jgi:hypothetical protein
VHGNHLGHDGAGLNRRPKCGLNHLSALLRCLMGKMGAGRGPTDVPTPRFTALVAVMEGAWAQRLELRTR